MTTIAITLPYPFVTQGARPIHVYDSVQRITVDSRECLLPGNELYAIPGLIGLEDYGDGHFGSTATVAFTFDNPGDFAYINIHVDYGLKGTGGWNKVANHAQGTGDYLGVTINDRTMHTFSFTETDGPGGSAAIQNENNFKRDPGFSGLVTDIYGNGVAGVAVEITSPTGKVLATVYTDGDGLYSYYYKHSGKAAYYTVSLPDFGLTQTELVKANAFVWVCFQLPPPP
jgi:hypothetical protein